MTGSVMSLVEDLTALPKRVSGNRRIVEGLIRRLSTPRGRLLDDKNYGTDIADMLGDTIDQRGVARLRAAVIAECLKDTDVATVHVEASYSLHTKALRLVIRGVGPSGSFSFASTVTAAEGVVLLDEAA